MKNIRLYLSLLFVLLLVSCHEDTPNNKNPTLTSYLLDSAVQGVDYYIDGTKKGTTDRTGQFTYRKNDKLITFKIGKLVLKEDFFLLKITDSKVFPNDLAGVARTNTTNDEVVKMLQVLQSLDDDGNPDNGINITTDIATKFTVDTKVKNNTINELVGKTTKSIVPKEVAKNHFKKSLKKYLNLNVGFIFTNDRVSNAKENQTNAVTLKAENDANSPVTYTISEGDSTLFNNNAGIITFKNAPNFENKTSYNFVATASNSVKSITQTIVINIENILENTIGISNQTRIVTENSTVDVSVGAALTTTSSPSGYSITAGNGDGFFKINSSGQIQIAKAGLDYESKTAYDLTVQIVKNDAATKTAVITVNITNVNEDTIGINNQARTISENSTADTSIGIVLTTTGNPSTFEITAGNTDGLFKINNSGQIQVAITGLDYENKASYSLKVQITKSDADAKEANINITITNVNENIIAISNQSKSVSENSAVNTSVSTILTTTGNPSTFEITAGNGDGFFQINNSGQIQVAKTGLNFEGVNSYSLKVKITKPDADAKEANINITITNVNENIIAISNQSKSVSENSAVNTSVGTILTTTGSPSTFEITAGNGDGFFQINNSGQIQVIKAELDYESKTSYDLTVKISKNDATDKTAVITVNITNILEDTIGINNQTRTVAENSTTDISVGAILITTGSPSSYLITAGDNSGLFKINNSGQIQVAKIGLDYETVTSYDLTVQIIKLDAATKTAIITVNIDNKFDFTSASKANALENVTANIYTATVDSMATTVVFSLDSSVGDNSLFNIDGTSGVLSFKNSPEFESPIDADHNSEYEVTIKATKGSDIATKMVTLNVVKRLPLLAILVEFNDIDITSEAKVWEDKLFGNELGQVNHYFDKTTNGRVQFVRVKDSQGTVNDGIVKIKMNENHPNARKDSGPTRRIQREICPKLKDYIDFSQYDLDKNNYLATDELQVLFIFAGGNTSRWAGPDGNKSVYAHKSTEPCTIDGLNLMTHKGWTADTVGSYIKFGERYGPTTDTEIGTIVHELGHGVFDAIDLYFKSYIATFGGMGIGLYNSIPGKTVSTGPAPYSAFTKLRAKISFPKVLTGVNNNVSIRGDVYEGNQQHYRVNTNRDKEYFLIENRPNVGYDKGLYGLWGSPNPYPGGLLITHIDENLGTTSYAIRTYEVLKIEIAKGGNYRYLATLFSNANNNTFNNDSAISSKKRDGTASGVAITNISAPGEIMTMDVVGN